MAREIRVSAYDRGRNEDVAAIGGRLHKLLGELAPLHPSLQPWAFIRDGKTRVIASKDDAVEAVRASGKPWEVAKEKRIAYSPKFFVDSPVGTPATMNVVAGMRPIKDVPAWTPNRYEIVLTDAALFDPMIVAAVLRRVIRNLDPDWANVRVDGSPAAPVSVFSDGSPVIAWMTYLSRNFPPVPMLTPPASAYSLPGLGTLVVVMPTLFDPADKAQALSVDLVRTELDGAKVLIPAYKMASA